MVGVTKGKRNRREGKGGRGREGTEKGINTGGEMAEAGGGGGGSLLENVEAWNRKSTIGGSSQQS